MEEHHSNGLTVRSGALILLVCLVLAATSYMTSMLPYSTQQSFTKVCTSTTVGKVVADEGQYSDGSMYYGPVVEYYHREKGQIVHAEATSTVKSNKKWTIGSEVNIAYDPQSPGDMYITDDDECERNYKQSLWVAAGMIAFGVVVFVIGTIRTIRGTDPDLYAQKFIRTPDGKSFSEWAEEQQKKLSEASEENENAENGLENEEPSEE